MRSSPLRPVLRSLPQLGAEGSHAVPSLACAIVVALALASCGSGEGVRTAGGGVRDTLPDGTPVVRYPAGLPPRAEAVTATPDLRIGSLEGSGPDVFGDVRGIEADPSGNVYVLDYAAAEVRVFGPDGAPLRTIARRGEGPGELGNSNGFVLAGDTLWVHDHSKMVMMGLSSAGDGELARSDVPVRSFAYVWMGTRDQRGRFWKLTAHSDVPRGSLPPDGLQVGTARTYLKVLDPADGSVDSVFVGEATYRSWVRRLGDRGFASRTIPFTPSTLTVVDPVGGFWQVSTDAYRIARLDASGDTTWVLEVPTEPIPVTDADREAFAAPLAERSPEEARMAEEILAIAPTTRPAVNALFLDDTGDLWVERGGASGDRPLYDVFSREGEYRGAVVVDADVSSYFPPRIRDGRLYTLVTDDLDVPYVVRVPLPSWARGG